MTRNARTTKVELSRIDICDLILACTECKYAQLHKGLNTKKWEKLHDKLKAQLIELDAEIDAESI